MNMHNKLPDPAEAAVYPYPPADGADREGASALRRYRVPLLVALAVLVIFGLYKAFGPSSSDAPVVPPPPPVTVMVPGTVSVADSVSAPGSIAARRDAAVGVQGEGGRVTAVLVDAGQSVRQGQVLVRVDRGVQIQQAAQLAASVRSAEADAALAESDLARAQALVAKGFISKADIDRRTATRDGARARVAVARAQLAETNARIARLDVVAPASGLVLARNVEVGQVVTPGSQPLFRIAEGGVLEMRAQVAEQDMARLKPGMSASVTPVGSATSYVGKVWLLDPVIDAVSRLGVARIQLAYAPGLRVGAFAKASIAAGEAVRPVLPQSAIQVDEKGNYVYVVGAGSKVERRDVTVGTVGDAGVAIDKGLSGSERVVVSAGAFLRPGERIKPVLASKAG